VIPPSEYDNVYLEMIIRVSSVMGQKVSSDLTQIALPLEVHTIWLFAAL
jgi:hypothetical protein